MNRDDFFNKMAWEGSPFELYNYGVKPEHINDPELRDLWERFSSAMKQAGPIADQLEIMSQEYWEKLEDEAEEEEQLEEEDESSF